MEKFYSGTFKCMIQQITKRTAKKYFEAGKEIFLQSSNMRFDNFWQSPCSLTKERIDHFYNASFESFCNEYTYYNCDSERGSYIHFFIRENDIKKPVRTLKDLEGLKDSEINELSKKQINALFRKEDDSNLWPICGRFNATERAIRKLRRLEKEGLEVNSGLEYYLALKDLFSEIVNKEA